MNGKDKIDFMLYFDTMSELGKLEQLADELIDNDMFEQYQMLKDNLWKQTHPFTLDEIHFLFKENINSVGV